MTTVPRLPSSTIEAPQIPGLTDLQMIGEGGFGVVYRARQEALDRDVAVKLLTRSGDPLAEARFRREAAVLGRLSAHPRIVTIYDIGQTDDGRTYLVMALVEGGSLQDRMDATGPQPWREVMRVGEAVADALTEAHSLGVLHRDIKPDNILFDRYGEPLLADFGIARLADGTKHTATGQITATLAYAAPEVLDGADATVNSEVYSLAATLVAAIRGAPAFDDDSPSLPTLLARIVTTLPPDVQEFGVPASLASRLASGMSKDPQGRPPTPLGLVEYATAPPVAAGEVAGAVREGQEHPPIEPDTPRLADPRRGSDAAAAQDIPDPVFDRADWTDDSHHRSSPTTSDRTSVGRLRKPLVASASGAVLVVLGLLVYSVSQTVPPKEVAEAPTPRPTESAATAPATDPIETLPEAPTNEPATAADPPGSYVVQAGDTLASIAAAVYGQAGCFGPLAEANGISEANPLEIGQRLVVPAEGCSSPVGTYVVRPGDTLSSIAGQVYGDTACFARLATANGISEANPLQVGQQLDVPADGGCS